MSSPKLPNMAKELSSVEAAWLGAMVDGEGSLFLRYRPAPTLRMEVCNTEPEFLSACLRITNTRGVQLKTDNSSRYGRKPVFGWYVNAWNTVLDLTKQIAPYSIKAQALQTVLGGITEKEGN